MTLPSQSARPIARGTNMYRRKRGGKRHPWLGVLVLLLVVTAAAWWFWPDNAEAESGSSPSDDFVAANPSGESGSGSSSQPSTEDFSGPSGGPGSAGQPSGDESSERSSREKNRQSETDSNEGASSTLEMGGSGSTNRNITTPGGQPTSPDSDPSTKDSEQSDRGGSSDSNQSERHASAPITGTGRGVNQMRLGLEQKASNKPVEARRTLTAALQSGDLNRAQADRVRTELKRINEKLVFSPLVIPADRFSMRYTLQSGDSLSNVVDDLGVQIDWRFLKRVNGISEVRRISAGQQIKVITGRFYEVNHKDKYPIDLYLGEGSQQVFVRSFPVGLGKYGSTPRGTFKVRNNSRLVNPEWVNPRTRERYSPDDPENPIGERWIGLKGVDERTEGLEGYGIHGTIEPDTIGQDASMGCVRMLPDDVAIVFEVLMPEVSRIEIR